MKIKKLTWEGSKARPINGLYYIVGYATDPKVWWWSLNTEAETPNFDCSLENGRSESEDAAKVDAELHWERTVKELVED